MNDPAPIQQCIPGCERHEEVEPAKYAAVVNAPIGPVWATFMATVTLSDQVPAEGYRIEAEGRGVIAWLGKLSASVGRVVARFNALLLASAK